jgi:hypothetical protein
MVRAAVAVGMQGGLAQVRGGALERHRARRAQRVPTVSVLVGDLDVADWYWGQWQRGHETAVVRVAGAESKDVLGAWLASKVVRDALRDAFYEQATRAHAVSRAELCARIAAHAEPQRDALLEQLCAGLEDWTPELVAAAHAASPEPLTRLVRRGFPGALAELDARLPRGLPSLAWRSSRDLVRSAFDGALSTLVALAEAVPRTELAIVVTEEQLAAWEVGARPRIAAFIREGVLRLEPALVAEAQRR